MFITLSDIAGKKLYVIPVVPPDVSIKFGGQNETLNTVKGDIRLVGDVSLREVSWSSIFPVNKKYSFVATGSLLDGHEYINFIETTIKAKLPARVIITSKDKRSISNKLMTIDDGFGYEINKASDIKYSIKLTEFPTDDWDYVNSSPEAQKYLSTLVANSVARKALELNGLI